MIKSLSLIAFAISVGLLAAPTVVAPALAHSFSQYDANSDFAVDTSEFAAALDQNGLFGRYDADGDGALSQEEFNAGLKEGYDIDDDGVLSEEEFGVFEEDIAEGGVFEGDL